MTSAAWGPRRPRTGIEIEMDLISLVAFYWIDIIGYTGAALMIAMLAMRTMIPLRGIGICNNILSALYGALAGVYPMLIQHASCCRLTAGGSFRCCN
jgi:hypothetical protein